MSKIKYRRTQVELAKTIEKYFPDSEFQDSQYYIMSQKVFWSKGSYEDSWEVAVQVIISTFNSFDKDRTEIISELLTIDMIYDRFNILESKPARTKNKIKGALLKLEEKGIIRINKIDGGISKKEYFTVIQNNVQEESTEKFYFFQLNKADVLKILFYSKTDNDRVNLLATYASLVSKMNDLNMKKAYGGTPTYSSALALLNAINTSSYSTIAESIGVTRNTAEKYVNQLVEMKLIASIKVHKQQDEAFKWSNYYSKYSERKALIDFANVLLTLTELPDNSESDTYHDYSWINIDDIWDDEIHTKLVTKQTRATVEATKDDSETHIAVTEEVKGMSEQEIDLGIDLDELVTEMIA